MERLIALQILINYEKDNTFLNIALNNALINIKDKHERDIITRLVYGTIQNRLFLEYQIKPQVHVRLKIFERMLILMSVYEHYFMRKPDYAIVNESVNLCKKEKGKRQANLVNAILRQTFDNERELPNDKEEALSIKTSHPLWMVKMFSHQYGFDKTVKICESNNDVPLKMARVNTLKITREELIKEDHLFTLSNNSESCVYYHGGNIASSNAFKVGKVTIQDESSQKVATLLNPKKNSDVLDMCGAPGSKTTHLAQIMENTGSIDVYDLYDHKIKLIEDNIKRLGVTNIKTHVGDSTDIKMFDKQYDYILLDGPCSGLGVLKRKPEIKYHESDIMDEIIPIQEKMLENAYLLCKIGGNIVYSTCTINKKENEKQIEKFINKHKDVKIVKEQTILPYEYNSDGFYMCLLKKDVL